MRIFVTLALDVGLVLGLSGGVRAQDEIKGIIEQAIKAHGGRDKIEKQKAVGTKSQGKLEIMGLTLPFTQEVAANPPEQFKETMSLDVMGQKVDVVTAYSKGKAWISRNGEDVPITDEIMDVLKDVAYAMKLGRFAFVSDKSFELSALGEIKVENKPALGIKVASKGHKDINLFFDKESGLMVKVEKQSRDIASGKDVLEERIITEYQDIAGLKVAKKVVVKRDGSPFMDLEVTEVKSVDKIDDSEFAKP